MAADYYGAFLAVTRELQETRDRLESELAAKDELILQLRADVASLGAQVKNVQVNAGGNTTTNRILSPGGNAAEAFDAPGDTQPAAFPPWAKWAGLGLVLALAAKLVKR
jgi:hypothetical protein